MLHPAIISHGAEVGLIVNLEKSMVSDQLAEINSTLFVSQGREKEKKTNANALYMKPDVSDVLGLAAEATVSEGGFVQVVRANARLLARQEDKFLWKLPYPLQRLCRKDRKIRKALRSRPVQKRPELANLFPVSPRPEGYDLSREEEVAIIRERVALVRADGLLLAQAKASTRRSFKTTVVQVECSWRSLLKKKKPAGETVLSILARAYRTKERDRLVKEDALTASAEGSPPIPYELTDYPSRILYLADMIRGPAWPKCLSERKPQAPSTSYVVDSEVVSVPFRADQRKIQWDRRFMRREQRRVLCKA
jgi:hypothetical protein